jgi:O-antigen/teichoic acid export membrane protein
MYDVQASKFIALCSLSGALSNILLAVLLIPGYKSYGAAAATLISSVIMSIITIIYSHKVSKIDFGLRSMILKTVFVTGSIVVGLVFTFIFKVDGFNWINIFYKAVLLALVGLVLFFKRRKEIFDMLTKILKSEKAVKEW